VKSRSGIALTLLFTLLLAWMPGCTQPGTARSVAPAPSAAPAQSGVTPTVPSVGVTEGYLAPDFALQDLNGQTFALSDLRGHVLLINFWAVWCGFCRIEIPELQAAYEAHQNQGLIVLGIDVHEDVDLVREFAEGMGMTFPVLLDAGGQVTLDYGIRGLPTTLFIDANGVISAVHIGPLDQETINLYLADIGVH
jgi:peroxiredoxin